MTLVMHSALLLIVLTAVIGVFGSVADDLVAAVGKRDADSVLQQVGHGASTNEPASNGQLPLVLAGTIFQLLHDSKCLASVRSVAMA